MSFQGSLSNSLSSYPAVKRIWYYADRSPDLASLLKFLNETASTVEGLHDPSLVDYAFSYTFTFSRSGATFSERGKTAAQDIRDGNEQDKIRQFSEAVLKLGKDPDLLPELTRHGITAIWGVLVNDNCKQQQQSGKSLSSSSVQSRSYLMLRNDSPCPDFLSCTLAISGWTSQTISPTARRIETTVSSIRRSIHPGLFPSPSATSVLAGNAHPQPKQKFRAAEPGAT